MPTRERRAKQLGLSIEDLPDGRGGHRNHIRGKKSHRWNDGRMIDRQGYVKSRVGKGHPLADANGYAYEHLMVWVSAGRDRPASGNLLHHINGDTQDNRIENLEAATRAQHNNHHNKNNGRDSRGRFVGKKKAGRELDGRTWNELPTEAAAKAEGGK